MGFDWDDFTGAFCKLTEEVNELKAAAAAQNAEHMEEELGDLLFSAVNVSRFLEVNPEEALKKATDKFLARFEKMERAAITSGRDLNGMTLAEMDELWNQAKDGRI